MRYFALLALLCLGCGLRSSSYKFSLHDWSTLILTHQWPQTFCNMEGCKTDFGYWTLHGLWPKQGVSCNSSWPFNASEIEDLLPQMRKLWPDLLHPNSSCATAFWKHEWQKHGTCAAHSETLDTEHKYFSKALELYQKLNLDGVLRNHSIVPSETPYMLDDIEGAIYSVYKVKPKIQCNGQVQGAQTLWQIEICFDRQYTLTDCQKSEEDNGNNPNGVLATDVNTVYRVCNRNVKVYYPPLKGKQ